MDLNNQLDRQVAELDFNGKRVIVRDNEEAVIGGVLRGGLAVYQRVREILKPEMFGNVSYGEIWNSIEKLYERGLSIDTITVGDELERAYKLDAVSNGARLGRALLSDLRNEGDPRNVESYAENIQDYHVKKQLEELGKKMVVWSANGRRAADIMNDVNAEFNGISLYSSGAQDYIMDISQAVSLAYDETDAASRGMIRRTQTGLPLLDAMLNTGLTGGQLAIVAGRPGQGKTALLLTMALNMMRNGQAVLLFSLEMTSREIAHRLLAQMSGVDVGRIQSGKLQEHEWGLYTNAVDELAAMRDLLTIIDLPTVKIGNIRQLVRREMAKKKYRAVMLDYIQLADGDDKKKERHLEVGQVSRGLKALAKEQDIPIIAAAQLSRAVEQRTNKRPILADLRESGSLEQDSDVVIFIYDKDEDDRTSVDRACELIVSKNRSGKVGDVLAIFKKSITRFESGTMR